MGVPRVPEAKAGPSRVQSWGPRAGRRREALYLEHRPRELELSGFSSCCWVFHFQRASLLGRVAGLAPQHGPLQTPLSPARALADTWGGAVPRSLPLPPPPTPQLSLSHCLFPLLFFPFYPRVIRENHFCRVNAGKARVAQLYVGAQPPRPPGRVLVAALSVWPRGTCPLPAGFPAPVDFGLMFLSKNQFPLLVYNMPQDDETCRPKMQAP